ncbi:hypothetical protein PIB30_065536 [Stylosanthes scabra]|uniref:Glycosyltransferase n=1 Tax=Stylosanthes scabra TaxID=79078 RepID=A0ABU6SM12_9FABA|nr:hypothetical protein [Stylosanthes scabra]
MSTPTVLVLPSPAQGHVNPMMSLSHKLVEYGCNIIFVNSDFNHKRVVSSMENSNNNDSSSYSSPIKLVSIPDGLGPEHDRMNFGELCDSMLSTMPSELEKLIEDMHMKEGIEVTCIVADVYMGWALKVANKLGIKGALFCPTSASVFVLQYNAPNLVADGILDSDESEKPLWLSSSIPGMDIESCWWLRLFDPLVEKRLFKYAVHCMSHSNLTEWCLCNSTQELEPEAFSLAPKLLTPIGPLLPSTTSSLGQFWEEDMSCMSWLDQQPHCSVIYIAFGSHTIFDQRQFTELALGLELTNRPFLWVVRRDPNCSNEVSLPPEFEGCNGKIIGWAPQKMVLSHPAIACFLSHCGWNSTLEALCNGVPLLCWPYFGDQFSNKNYVCDALKVGMGFDSDENGLISRGEIKAKVDQLVSDENTRSRSQKLMEKLKHNMEQGSTSSKNLSKFVTWLKE